MERNGDSLMLKPDLQALLPGVLEAVIKINWEARVFVACSNYFFSLACFYELVFLINITFINIKKIYLGRKETVC